MNAKHIPTEKLQLLLNEDCDNALDRQDSEHLANCEQCQRILDSLAAMPKVWEKASELISEPLMSEMAIKRAAASYSSQSQEVTSDPEFVAVSRDSAEFVLDGPSHPEMLGRIGNYDIEREVGRGGMGIVFKAFDTELHRPLAIKVLAPWLAQNATARKRFAREAQSAATVIHPNVISIYGVNASQKTPYIVMPYVAGPSLQRLIDEHGPLDEKDIVRITMQIAAGLGAAHAQGLVHRDIKPANILVEPEVSRVLVTDFGLARAVDDASATHSGYFVGTPNYMSPEQAMGRRVDGRSDLFSLGSLIYFMATGRMPFRAETPLCVLNRISHDEPTGVQQVNSEISKTITDVVSKLLEKRPEDRFQTAGEVHSVMEKYLAYLNQPDVSKPPKIAVRKKAKGAKSKRALPYALASVVAFIAFFAVSYGSGWLPGSSETRSNPAGLRNEKNDGPATNAPGNALGDTKWEPEPGLKVGTPWEQPSDEQQTRPWDAPKLGGSGSWPTKSADPSTRITSTDGDVGIPGEFVTVKRTGLGKNIDGYTLYLPEGYSERDELYPVIFYLQGALGVGGDVSQVNNWGLPKLVAEQREQDGELRELLRERFVVISPHIVSGDYFDDLMAMKSIIDEVGTKHRLDRSRVYLTGLSHGAAGTWAMASRLEGVWAAAAPLGGQPYGVRDQIKLAKIPMWVAHNVGDHFGPIARLVTKVNQLSKVPFKPIDAATELSESELANTRIFMTGETDEHDAWSRVYSDPKFYRWLLRQRR